MSRIVMYSNSHVFKDRKQDPYLPFCIFKLFNLNLQYCYPLFILLSPFQILRHKQNKGERTALNKMIIFYAQIQEQYIIICQMRNNRLNTEELIQATRNNYDISKQQQKYHELQVTLQLRNKEVQYLTSQIASTKEQFAGRLKMVQGQLTQHKKQLAELKFTTVKEKRAENQKYQKDITSHRIEFEKALGQKENQFQNRVAEMKRVHEQQIEALKLKYENHIKLERNESSMCKIISEEQSSNSFTLMKKLEEDKNNHLKVKRQVEHQLMTYKDAIQALQKDFKGSLEEKEEQIANKEGQIMGLTLKVKLLQQKLEETQTKKTDFQIHSFQQVEQLKHTNSKLEKDLQSYRTILNSKDDEVLQQIKELLKTKKIDKEISAVQECNHQGLILQMERNIELKDKQLQELRKTVEEWTLIIGFDRPVSQRLHVLTQKCANTSYLNESWTEKLKSKAKMNKNMKKMRF